ncbi:MAG: mechanosensitive ion channel domain-containing protein [Sedimenticolaceae bacterium]
MRLATTLAGVLIALFITASLGWAKDADEPTVPEAILTSDIEIDELALRLTPLTVAELAAAAEAWRDIVKDKTEEVVSAQIAANKAKDNDNDAVEEQARQQLTELAEARGALFDRYSTVVNSWEKKGGSGEAIEEFRAYRNSIIVEETRTADFETLMARALAWSTAEDGGIALAISTAVILASLFGLLFVARIIRRMVRKYIVRVPNLSKLLQVFLVGLVYWIVLAFGLMIVLSGLGVDISPVFALVGGASFILAFAFQDTLGNLASGLMIMVNRPFDEGDYVDIGGVAGTVKSVSIVATTVTTPDNQVIVIPNKNVWGNVITNVTTSETRRVDLTFGIGYDDDIETAQRVLEEVVSAHPLVLKDPAPVIRVGALGASSVDFIVRPWTKTVDYWTVYWDLTRQVKESFDAAGVSIPYPQQDLHIKDLAAITTRVETHQASPPKPSAPSSAPKTDTPRDAAAAMAQGDS